MGDDGNHAGGLEFEEDACGALDHGDIGKFDEEVGESVDGEAAGMLECGLDILEGEMEIAALVDAEAWADGKLECGDALGDELRLVGINDIGMGSSDEV